MSPQNKSSLITRRDRALEQLDLGRQALARSLEGLQTEDAFLGSRWSVWDVIKHLDSPEFVDSLERIAAGEQETLPPFDSRDAHLKRDIERQVATSQRLRNLVTSLTEEQLVKPVTPPNPHNSFPGLRMIDLVERIVQHEATHARQIDATRKYVAEFSAKDRAVTFIGIGNGDIDEGDPDELPRSVKDLLSYADYTAGTAAALENVRPWIRGVEIVLTGDNAQEVLARLGREARAGQWPVVVCLGEPYQSCPELVELARQYCARVVVR